MVTLFSGVPYMLVHNQIYDVTNRTCEERKVTVKNNHA